MSIPEFNELATLLRSGDYLRFVRQFENQLKPYIGPNKGADDLLPICVVIFQQMKLTMDDLGHMNIIYQLSQDRAIGENFTFNRYIALTIASVYVDIIKEHYKEDVMDDVMNGELFGSTWLAYQANLLPLIDIKDELEGFKFHYQTMKIAEQFHMKLGERLSILNSLITKLTGLTLVSQLNGDFRDDLVKLISLVEMEHEKEFFNQFVYKYRQELDLYGAGFFNSLSQGNLGGMFKIGFLSVFDKFTSEETKCRQPQV